ncbi:MAG: GAF domain-containing protein [Anaerolineales bacterium]|uniref:GAF domain-containing sensor histidine kinase n=1 Tax=Candidatus Villigracilis affinis TaxID=3140682 RepID=UPI002A2104B5|nr:GAF domain-containing protein [Anaerolineales bacterium]MBL0344535.1 GAF domain-containing protein [Anaerolineales bacterium]
MSPFISQILELLTISPGNLVYYVVLVFAVASALQSAFNHWRASEYPQARRALVGLGVLLAAQVIMFVFSGLGWQDLIDPNAILPPMDRAFIVFGIIWITWVYAFPEPSRPADAAAVLLSLLVLTALGLSLLTWQPQITTVTYNQTADDLFWQIGSILAALIGISILFVRKPDGMWYGIVLLGIGALGHVGHLLVASDGNYSGIVRLAYMVAYPILLTLPQRFSSTQSVNESSTRQAAQKQDDLGERRRYSTDPKTFHAMLALAAETNPTKVSQAITRAIAQTMLSDLCFMIYLNDSNNQLAIAGGYDLIREDTLDGGSLNKGSIPMLANSLQRGRPLRMPSSSTSADIKGLSDILGLTNPGHLLSVPILTPEKESLGGILLLSPYSDRTWTAEDQAYLSNIATSLVPIIKRSQKVNKMEAQSSEALLQVADLERRVRELTDELEKAQAEVQKAGSVEMASLLQAQEESQRIIEQLQLENGELRSGKSLQPGSYSATQIEQELRTTLQEVAYLQNQLMEANMKTRELEKGHVAVKSTEQAEVVASIAQELRQPLSSIVGYTDLLLGESVGILGALQRKFVERVKASTERIRSLTDDMIQITTLEAELNDLNPEAVDLNAIIDNAMSYTSTQVREKNISMHLELPKTLSPIHADREALQQILIHLLQNAGAATPFEGTVRLKVQTRSEENTEFILIQVTDSGGGIPANELPRVFTRLYRADNVLIQGVGDTGVGLSIAKTLTEAQHGRIWVESEQDTGSTFSVLLPIAGGAESKSKTKPKGKK